jgi:hypothetical protein
MIDDDENDHHVMIDDDENDPHVMIKVIGYDIIITL